MRKFLLSGILFNITEISGRYSKARKQRRENIKFQLRNDAGTLQSSKLREFNVTRPKAEISSTYCNCLNSCLNYGKRLCTYRRCNEHGLINIYDVNQYVLGLMDYYYRTASELAWCIREIVTTVLYLIRNVIVISEPCI